MHEGVCSATISAINDGEYEFEMNIAVNSNIIEDTANFDNIIDTHIRTIANFTKFNVGKIRYNHSEEVGTDGV